MSRISIRHLGVDVEFEGSEEFIKADLLDLINDITELTKALPASTKSISSSPKSDAGGLDLSVKTIATKLGTSTGSDLARSAAAFLTLVEGRETFTQSELHDAMKTAVGIYKQSTHAKNIGKIITGLLTSNILLQTATGNYSLSQPQRDQIEKALNG